MNAWQFDGETRLFERLFSEGLLAQIFQLTHDALRHEHEGLVLQYLLQLLLDVDSLLAEVVEEIAVQEHLEGRVEFHDHTPKVDELVILLTPLYSHF